jgi:hypothetical protein
MTCCLPDNVNRSVLVSNQSGFVSHSAESADKPGIIHRLATSILNAVSFCSTALCPLTEEPIDLRSISQMDFSTLKKFLDSLPVTALDPIQRNMIISALNKAFWFDRREEYVPIVTSIHPKNSSDLLPTVVRKTEQVAKATCVRSNGLYLTPEAAKEKVVCHQIPDKQTLDEIVRQLAQSDFLCCQFEGEGCFARARLSGLFLHATGVPIETMSIVQVNYPVSPQFKYNFHQVLSVRLQDGSEWIVDPMLDPNQALSLSEWQCKLNAVSIIHDESIPTDPAQATGPQPEMTKEPFDECFVSCDPSGHDGIIRTLESNRARLAERLFLERVNSSSKQRELSGKELQLVQHSFPRVLNPVEKELEIYKLVQRLTRSSDNEIKKIYLKDNFPNIDFNAPIFTQEIFPELERLVQQRLGDPELRAKDFFSETPNSEKQTTFVRDVQKLSHQLFLLLEQSR